MGGASQMPLPFPFPVLIIIGLIISLVSILIAFDARDRGMSKFVSVMWALAVQMFPPAALVYLLVRYFAKKMGAIQTPGAPPGAPPAAPPGTKFCPYCGVSLPQDARLCSRCSKLL
jgi:hypothetical protein